MHKKWIWLWPVLIVILALGFQNCGHVNFGAADGKITSSGTYTLMPGTEDTAADAKILLVIDNSESMRQAQQYLSNGIDSLLASLNGRSFQLKIVTTTPFQGMQQKNFHYVTQNGRDVEWSYSTAMTPEQQPVGTHYGDKLSHEIRASTDNASITGCSNVGGQAQCTTVPTFFSYRLSDGPNAFDSIKTNIKNAVLGLGTSGGDAEQGICPVLKSLYSQSPDKFFNSGDKAAIVILSDENDSSSYANCLYKGVTNWRITSWIDYTLHQYRLRVAQYILTYEYQYISDGVTRVNNSVVTGYVPKIGTTDYLSNGTPVTDPAVISHNEICSTTRQQFIEQRLLARNIPSNGTYVRTLNCTYNNAESGSMGIGNTLANLDIPSHLGTTQFQSLCSNGFSLPLGTQIGNVEMGGAYLNIIDFYQKFIRKSTLQSQGVDITPRIDTNPAYCQFRLSSRRVQNMNEAAPKSHEYFGTVDPEIGSTQNLKIGIRNRLRQLFGSQGYFVSSIVLTNQCGVGSNQSIGAAYIDLANLVGARGAVHPICQSDYSTAMTQLSDFISKAVSQSLRVHMASSLQISAVSVLRNGNIIDLQKDQDYEVTGNVIQFTGFHLEMTDSILVTVSLIQPGTGIVSDEK